MHILLQTLPMTTSVGQLQHPRYSYVGVLTSASDLFRTRVLNLRYELLTYLYQVIN